jgi:hypothetical protein
MEGYCSTGQSPQRAVVPMEEEEEEEEEDEEEEELNRPVTSSFLDPHIPNTLAIFLSNTLIAGNRPSLREDVVLHSHIT